MSQAPVSLETETPTSAAARNPQVRDSALALKLLENRDRLASLLADGLVHWEKYAVELADPRRREEFLTLEIHVFIEYLADYFRAGDPVFFHLYLGEKVKQCYVGDEGLDERRRRLDQILSHDEKALLETMRTQVGAESLERLAWTLGELRRILLAPAPATANVLFVGDCLFLDMTAYLTAPCLEDGITLNPTFATPKNGPALRSELKRLADKKFDLVFYSPFTFDFSPVLSSYMRVGRCLDGRRRIETSVGEALADVESTLAALADQFECPILVQNTRMVRRNDGSPLEWFKDLATRRARRLIRDRINLALDDFIKRANSASFEHLFPLDEFALLEGVGDFKLGRLIKDSKYQHPSELGRALVDPYRDAITARLRLLGRKLVVTDLDNTLWDGVIGEGAVAHHRNRQRILLKLKSKGVVLATNSSNDPARVKWDGALLNAGDFVNHQINWDPKVVNMKRIHEALNLKYKDYVFIDDRGDQLAMVGASMPEIQLLDATSERSWKLLDAWAGILADQAEGDRTQLYRERERREGFLADQVEVDPTALFANLGIRVTVRAASRSDLQRLAELINRTNQFNLAGSRTSFRELTQWFDDPAHMILVVDAADKFGQMGTVCAAVAEREAGRLKIPIFVLSCRVFGYGIETVVLNSIKRLALSSEDGAAAPIVGLFKETSHNGPCHSMYPDHGFLREGDCWIHAEPSALIPEDPAWLTIENRIDPPALAGSASHRGRRD